MYSFSFSLDFHFKQLHNKYKFTYFTPTHFVWTWKLLPNDNTILPINTKKLLLCVYSLRNRRNFPLNCIAEKSIPKNTYAKMKIKQHRSKTNSILFFTSRVVRLYNFASSDCLTCTYPKLSTVDHLFTYRLLPLVYLKCFSAHVFTLQIKPLDT